MNERSRDGDSSSFPDNNRHCIRERKREDDDLSKRERKRNTETEEKEKRKMIEKED